LLLSNVAGDVFIFKRCYQLQLHLRPCHVADFFDRIALRMLKKDDFAQEAWHNLQVSESSGRDGVLCY